MQSAVFHQFLISRADTCGSIQWPTGSPMWMQGQELYRAGCEPGELAKVLRLFSGSLMLPEAEAFSS